MQRTAKPATRRRPSGSVTTSTLAVALLALACGDLEALLSDSDAEEGVEATVTDEEGPDAVDAADGTVEANDEPDDA